LPAALILSSLHGFSKLMSIRQPGHTARARVPQVDALINRAITVQATDTAILCNKCCLPAYHAYCLNRLKDAYWALDNALPVLLNADLRACLLQMPVATQGRFPVCM
jgi:hypothetical protein